MQVRALSHHGHQSVLAKAFIFVYSLALTSCSLADPEGTDLPGGLVNSQRDGKQLTWEMLTWEMRLSHADHPTQSRFSSYLFSWALALWATIGLPKIPQNQVPDKQEQLLCQSPLKLFKLPNPKPAYLVSPVPFHGNHSIGL